MLKSDYELSPLEFPVEFQDALVSWFQEGARDYPWRRTVDPYQILVSEVMLQQTTIQSVVENRRFERFIEEFPDPETLAQASEQAILRAWEGLGYYNRVRNLQKTAREVVEQHGGEFPKTLEGLQTLPGIGAYTSAAVASFAYNLSAPLVDANVARLFSRLFDDHTEIDSSEGQKAVWELARELVSIQEGRAYNSALMELGQRVCKSREVHCMECPVAQFCQTQTPLELPVKKPKKKASEVTEHALWLVRGESKVFLQKGSGSRRKGMWTLPLVSLEQVALFPLIHESKYTITRYKVSLRVYEAELAEGLEGEWKSISELQDLPMPSPIRRVINELLR